MGEIKPQGIVGRDALCAGFGGKGNRDGQLGLIGISAKSRFCRQIQGIEQNNFTLLGIHQQAVGHIHGFDRFRLRKAGGSIVAVHRVQIHRSHICSKYCRNQQCRQDRDQYQAKARVDAAVILLKNEELPMSRIAELAGFRSESVFYQRFKEQLGVSPKAYQKLHRK